MLCVDPKPRETDIGHADGVLSRTLEIFASLGLEMEITKFGRKFTEIAAWQRKPDGNIEQLMVSPFFFAPARFNDTTTIHQGRVERILGGDLKKYSRDGVHYNSSVEKVEIDEADAEYPAIVTIKHGDELRTVRAKYVVGADGAHSAVRRSLGIEMEGEVVDEIWGVIDCVADTDFPDIRRTLHIFAKENQARALCLQIPREKLSNGDWLTRFYVDMATNADVGGVVVVGDEEKEDVRRKKAEIKKDQIMEAVANRYAPYSVKIKEGTLPLWWATYNVGQRLAEKYFVTDSKGHPRAFLVGDGKSEHFDECTWLTDLSMSHP